MDSSEHAANIMAGVTGTGALIAFFAQWLPVVQFAAGIMAVVVGGFAIRAYIRSHRK